MDRNRPQPPAPRQTDARRRDRALRLLADGGTVADAARAVDADPRTVRRWKASTEGSATLAEATQAADAVFASTVEAARSKLAGAANEATDVLLGILRDTKADRGDRLRAAGMIYDRVGLPRTQRVETPPAPLDLTGLTAEELAEFERLNAKVASR